jgi:hypothetical protein
VVILLIDQKDTRIGAFQRRCRRKTAKATAEYDNSRFWAHFRSGILLLRFPVERPA